MVDGHVIEFQLDSGATVNVLPVREYKKVCGDPGFKELRTSEAILSLYNSIEIHPLGKKRISLGYPKNSRKCNLELQIVTENNQLVLGASAIHGMELITVTMQNVLPIEESGCQELRGLTNFQVVTQYVDVLRVRAC